MNRATVTAEFGNGKRHASEERARILAITARSTFLIGDAVICALHEKLGGTLEPYDREYAEGNVKTGAVCDYARLATETAFYLFGKLAALTGLAGTVAIAYSRAEHYGLYGFNNGNGIVGCGRIQRTDAAEAVCRIRCIGYCPALATVKNNLFFDCSESSEGLTSSHAYAGLKLNLNVIANSDAVKSTIKGNLVYSDVCPKELCRSGSDVCRISENFFTACAEIYSCILKAISVTATVKHSLCVNAYCSAAA